MNPSNGVFTGEFNTLTTDLFLQLFLVALILIGSASLGLQSGKPEEESPQPDTKEEIHLHVHEEGRVSVNGRTKPPMSPEAIREYLHGREGEIVLYYPAEIPAGTLFKVRLDLERASVYPRLERIE